ncbi:MAG: hypothetical protein IM638_08340 [Bacteroidetes bacterium]|nr:hypothetical protein [Bacteroidota bacterium]
MRMLLILIPALLWGCHQAVKKQEATTPEINTLQQWLNTQPRSKHTLVFAMNANDCIPCMRIFSQFFRRQSMRNTDTVQLVALFNEVRSIERPAILESVFQQTDTAHVKILWNTTLFTDAIAQVKEGKGVSALLVYDEQRTLKFARFGKTLTGLEPELAAFREK